MIGLTLNASKCELITSDHEVVLAVHNILPSVTHVDPRDAIVLGAPLGGDVIIGSALHCKLNEFQHLAERLKNLNTRDAFIDATWWHQRRQLKILYGHMAVDHQDTNTRFVDRCQSCRKHGAILYRLSPLKRRVLDDVETDVFTSEKIAQTYKSVRSNAHVRHIIWTHV